MRKSTYLIGMALALLGGSLRGEALAEPASNVTFVAFDLETTGFDREHGGIIEIGAVKFRGDKILKTRQWLINPGVPIAPQATAVHGISDDMVTNAPLFPEVYAEFLKFAGPHVLLAHNARFDIGFIEAEARRHGMPLPPGAVIDTLALARRRYPDAENHRMENLVQLLNLPASDFHRGLVDAIHVMNLMNMVMDGDLATRDALLAAGEITYPPTPTPTLP